MEDDGVDFFNRQTITGSGEVTTPPDDEARFEEGIPLVQPEAQLESPTPTSRSGTLSTREAGEDSRPEIEDEVADAGLPSRVPFRPEPLNRKTTEQVLDSLHFSSHRETYLSSKATVSETKPGYVKSVRAAVETDNGVAKTHDEEGTAVEDVHNLQDGNVGEKQQNTHTALRLFDGDQTEVAPDHGLEASKDEASPEDPTSLEATTQETTQADAPSDDLAALWQAALDDDDFLADGETLAEPNFFEDDGQGFLDDEQARLHPEMKSEGDSPSSSFHGGYPGEQLKGSNPLNSSYPQTNGYQQMVPNRYTPNAPGFSNASSPVSASSDFTRQSRYIAHPPMQPQQGRPPLPTKTHSFADQSKGGYTSPYDMPLEMSRPKKRTHLQQTSWGSVAHNHSMAAPPAPPPRSSSMYTGQPTRFSPPQAPSVPSKNVTSSSLPPLPSVGSSTTRAGASSQIAKAKPDSFFEELPITTKPRPQSALGRAMTQQPPIGPSPLQAPSFATGQPSYSPPPEAFHLQAPERVNPYAIPPQSALSTPPIPNATSRYSSAPPTQSNAPQSRTRYATPPASGPSPSRAVPFQPRTSSPLAHHQKSYHQQPQTSTSAPHPNGASGDLYSSSDAGSNASPQRHNHPKFASQKPGGAVANEDVLTSSVDGTALESPVEFENTSVLNRGISDTPSSTSSPPTAISPLKRATSAYVPQPHSYGPVKDPVLAAPRRSQTQSPGKLFSGSRLPTIPQEPYPRPASVHEPTSYLHPANLYGISASQQPGHQRSTSQTPNFITPTDGREADPLQRWEGCPIFVFGFGGTIVSSFPKHIPRYSAGHTAPMIKCSPGEVQLRSTNTVLPLENHVAKFPGPLRTKGKKKDILNWLDNSIVALEGELPFVSQGITLPDPRKRLEEKVMLWKVLRTLVDHDGILEGNSNIEKLTRMILSPELAEDGSNAGADSSYVTGGDLVGISKPSGSSIQSDPVNHEFVESLRKLLVEGEREKAVWHAVDKRLWAHAMLISSTLSNDVWKQVAQEFVRQEVKLVGNNTESLAALYEVFAGNWDESIDELVPPSARAGLQMISKIPNNGPTKNALDGLDRWRETLSLILSNRSTGDPQAILALGRLLSGYGRIEAAHICYLFVRSVIIFGGSDNPQAHITLIGADLVQQSFGDAAGMDAILLSEVYEYCISVSPSSSTTSVVPHLQGYKLYHAMKLAEYGYRAEAQQYSDTIANSLKMTTKLAPYYHSMLFSALDDLTKRLQQSPKDGSSSWISKPSMDKVSGSVWAKFNSFVAGDDHDAPSTGSGRQAEPEVGPFAKVAGGTPTISRSPSNTDLYGSYSGVQSGPPSVVGMSNARYAPTGPYAPRTSMEQPGRSSYELQRPSPYEPVRSQGSDYGPPYQPHVPSLNSHNPQYQPLEHWRHSQGSLGLQDSVEPSQRSAEQAPFSLKPLPSPYQQDAFRPTPPSLHTTPFEGYDASQGATQTNEGPVYPTSNYNSSAYEPVSSVEHGSQNENNHGHSYEPPSYEPHYDDPEASPTLEKPKKRFSMDDDEDKFTRKGADVAKKEKARKDNDADEAFRKAAAEDAKKDGNPGDKKGWFGGWFGKKDPNAGPGPIKAKLGEESSFYYDPDLKKWINKKGGTDTSTPSAKPPPPRGPPIRAVSSPPVARNPIPTGARLQAQASVSNLSAAASTSMPSVTTLPPSGPPSGTGTPQRTDSPVEPGSMLVPPSLAAIASGAGSGQPSGPPSRPTTSMSNASSIDDLIGAPAARKGGTVKKTKKGRGYVDIMAK